MLHWFHGPIPTATISENGISERVPRTLDGILDELKRGSFDKHHRDDEIAQSAVEGISDRPSKTGRFPRRAA